MAKLPPPPDKGSRKGEPPTIAQAKGNLDKPEPGELANLNFKVPEKFKQDFKIAAIQSGRNQVEFLQYLYDFWSSKHG